MRWRVRRDPRGVAADADAANDAFPRVTPAVLATATLPTMRIRFVPIVLSEHAGATGSVTVGNLAGYLNTLRRTFPVGTSSISVGTPLVSSANFGTVPTGGSEGFWLQVLQDLDLARVADTSSHDSYWMGVVRPPTGFTFTNFGGFSYIPSQPASLARGTRTSTVVQTGWFTNAGQTADLVAHELAHTLGRRHAPCGGATGLDPNFPVANGRIGTVGHDVYSWSAGFSSNAAPLASTTGDMMGYCFPQWASPYTYAGLLAARLASAPVAVRQASRNAGARQQVIVVRGRISRNGVSLLPAIAISGFPSDDAAGEYRVELLDASGRVLGTQRVDAVGVDHSRDSTLTVAIPLDELAATAISTIRVIGPRAFLTKGRPTRSSFDVQLSAGPSLATIATHSSGAITAECRGTETAAIALQDRVTGAVLASAMGNRVTLETPSRGLIDISCSDGVRSRRHAPERVTPSIR